MAYPERSCCSEHGFEADRRIAGRRFIAQRIEAIELEHRPGWFDAVQPLANFWIVQKISVQPRLGLPASYLCIHDMMPRVGFPLATVAIVNFRRGEVEERQTGQCGGEPIGFDISYFHSLLLSDFNAGRLHETGRLCAARRAQPVWKPIGPDRTRDPCWGSDHREDSIS
jgi:hypothetical protein